MYRSLKTTPWPLSGQKTIAPSLPTPKVGLMKLQSLPGEHRYAVAIREGSELWLTLWVRRSPKGEFFVMVPRADRGWDPHNSYHLDGTFHGKCAHRSAGAQTGLAFAETGTGQSERETQGQRTDRAAGSAAGGA